MSIQYLISSRSTEKLRSISVYIYRERYGIQYLIYKYTNINIYIYIWTEIYMYIYRERYAYDIYIYICSYIYREIEKEKERDLQSDEHSAQESLTIKPKASKTSKVA